MKGYRTKKSDGLCHSRDGRTLCALDGKTECFGADVAHPEQCRGIIFVKIKRKPVKRGPKVLARMVIGCRGCIYDDVKGKECPRNKHNALYCWPDKIWKMPEPHKAKCGGKVLASRWYAIMVKAKVVCVYETRMDALNNLERGETIKRVSIVEAK